MRKNFALLGAAIVVCLVARPALAADEDIGQSFKLAAKALAISTMDDGPLTTASVATGGTDTALAKPEATTPKAPKKAKTAAKKPKKKRVHERLVARINLSSQTMNVMVDGKTKHTWKISSGAKGHHTPTGSYKPYYMTSMHYSKKYDNAPMPHSVFFRGGYAVHATGAVRRLGNPASHGCVRLAPGNARKFFKLVQRYKKAGTRIRISGTTPASRGFKKRYASRPARRSRNNSSWDNFQGYSNNYVSYRRRNVRRIRINRARRNPNGTILGWQF